jgi:hypothetical protein
MFMAYLSFFDSQSAIVHSYVEALYEIKALGVCDNKLGCAPLQNVAGGEDCSRMNGFVLA